MKQLLIIAISILCSLPVQSAGIREMNSKDTEELVSKTVTTTEYGQLAALLGDEVNSIDVLTVNGPIDAADFYVMMEASFFGNLIKVDLTNADIKDNRVPDLAFVNDRINAPASNTVGYTIGGGMKLEEIYFPTGLREIGAGAFQYCSHLKKADLPSGLVKIDDEAFWECDRLTVDKLPGSLEEIGEYAFSGCRFNDRISLPISLRSIGAAAFKDCVETIDSPHSIVFPATLEKIGAKAFQGVGNLLEVYCKATVPPVCEFGPEYKPEDNPLNILAMKEGVVYVPTGSLEAYKKAEGWKECSRIVEMPVEDMPESGVECIISDSRNQEDNSLYDLNGRRVLNPVKGEIYLQSGRKVIYTK